MNRLVLGKERWSAEEAVNPLVSLVVPVQTQNLF